MADNHDSFQDNSSRNGCRPGTDGLQLVAAGAVAEALDAVRRAFGEPQGLISDLPADATWARARAGELNECIPRLLELWAAADLEPVPAQDVLAHLADNWDEFPPAGQRAIESLADVLWTQALTTHPSEPSADELLGQLIHLRLPMVRWLEPWLGLLDGPGAPQLADSILRHTEAGAWAAVPDARSQLEAWARSEPVVMGIAVVGGVHLDEGDFGALLDRLV